MLTAYATYAWHSARQQTNDVVQSRATCNAPRATTRSPCTSSFYSKHWLRWTSLTVFKRVYVRVGGERERWWAAESSVCLPALVPVAAFASDLFTNYCLIFVAAYIFTHLFICSSLLFHLLWRSRWHQCCDSLHYFSYSTTTTTRALQVTVLVCVTIRCHVRAPRCCNALRRRYHATTSKICRQRLLLTLCFHIQENLSLAKAKKLPL